MSEVFIPLGGAGGKNRGDAVQVDEDYTYLKAGNSGVVMPLPAGTYKALKLKLEGGKPVCFIRRWKECSCFYDKRIFEKGHDRLFRNCQYHKF